MSQKKLYMMILLSSMILWRCFPDRRPVDPIELETRRPEIAYTLPVNGDTIVTNSVIEIWFDEIMNTTSLINSLSVDLSVAENQWAEISSVAALAQSIANPDLLFSALRDKGLFYSTNSGTSWRFQTSTAETKILFIQVDPVNPSLIYINTTQALMRSNNGGSSWQMINSGLPSPVTISSFQFDPLNSDHIWIGTNSGIYHSLDAGENWIKAGSLPQWTDQLISKIEIDPANVAIIYAATLGRFIYKSTDGGITWALKRGITNQLPGSRIFDIVTAPQNSSVLYAATDNRGIYKSVDAGENWNNSAKGIVDLNTRKIRFAPNHSNIIFTTTTTTLYQSTDSGNSWTQVVMPFSNVSIVEFLVDPDDENRLLLATGENIYYTSNSGGRWNKITTIDPLSISLKGNIVFTEWQGFLSFVEATGDTVIISPHRYDDILAAYDAGMRSSPAVDPNPKATKLTFIPFENWYKGWMYRVKITGAFDSGKWREITGAQDIHGMSLESDFIFYFFAN